MLAASKVEQSSELAAKAINPAVIITLEFANTTLRKFLTISILTSQ